MTTRDDFNQEQWAAIEALPRLVIMGAGRADGDPVPAVREQNAGAKALKEVIDKYPENAVLQLFSPEGPKPDSRSDAEHVVSTYATDVDASETLFQIEQGIKILRSKATAEESAQITEALSATAWAVVERLGSGVLGLGREKVDSDEAKFIAGLEAVLHA
jgi:hypothetical protein